MRIGVLETDTLEHDIKNKYGSYAEMFQQLFLSINNKLEFNIYQVIEEIYPENIDECDAYLITGSKFSAYEDSPWIKKLSQFIISLAKQRKKLIGICFGHQIIAHALGGLTEKSNKGWGVGNIISDIEKTQAWMGGEKKQFSLLVSHQDQVTKLPATAKRIASNAFCLNTSFQIDNHILTFQGHPEFSNDYLRYLMKKRRKLIGNESYNRALSSLDQDQDSLLVAQWIINFIAEEAI